MSDFFSNTSGVLSNRTFHPEGIRFPASVLVPMFNINGSINIMLTQRALNLDRQPGDFCFPGGMAENNETPEQTAIRETFEETGINKKDIKILGHLDYIVSSFGAYITPFAAKIDNSAINKMSISKGEVEKVIFVPLIHFISVPPQLYRIEMKHSFPKDFPFDKIYGGKNYQWRKSYMDEYFYEYNGDVIWGITARIVKNLCDIIKENNISIS